MVYKVARRRLHDLLPPRRRIPTGKSKGKHQRRMPATQILSWHPGPRKSPAAAEGDLAFGGTDIDRTDTINGGAEGGKEHERLWLAGKKLIKRHLG